MDGWLKNEFPQPGRMLIFPFTHTLGQFEFLLASVWIGRFAFVLFVAALFLLWTGRTRLEQSKARALTTLLVLPFVLGIAGSYARQFPYGATRHTVVLGLFAATGIAIFIGTLPRRVGMPLVWGMLLLAPLWERVPLREDIAAERHQKSQILQCLDYMRANIPAGALIFTERETLDVLAYYAGHDKFLPWPERSSTSQRTSWRADGVLRHGTTCIRPRLAFTPLWLHSGGSTAWIRTKRFGCWTAAGRSCPVTQMKSFHSLRPFWSFKRARVNRSHP